jgi:hypothetical protein
MRLRQRRERKPRSLAKPGQRTQQADDGYVLARSRRGHRGAGPRSEKGRNLAKQSTSEIGWQQAPGTVRNGKIGNRIDCANPHPTDPRNRRCEISERISPHVVPSVGPRDWGSARAVERMGGNLRSALAAHLHRDPSKGLTYGGAPRRRKEQLWVSFKTI